MATENTAAQQQQTPQNSFSVSDFLKICLSHWLIFAISVMCFIGIGTLYYLRKQPQYLRSSQILIQNQDMGSSPSIDVPGAFTSLGFMGSNAQVNNEIIAMQSPSIMGEVVKRLDLTMNYAQRIEFFHRTPLYSTDLPVKVDFIDLGPQDMAGFRMVVQPDGSYELDKFYKIEEKLKKLDFQTTGKLNQVINSPVGRIKIYPNPVYAGKIDEVCDIKVAKNGFQQAIEEYLAKLTIELANDEAEVIDLSIKDYSTQRATDILNTIITVYNERWVEDKNLVSNATSKFIGERLKILEHELSVVDSDIFNYKSEHVIPDLQVAAELYMNEAAKQDEEIQAVLNRLAMTNYVKDYMTDPNNKYQVLPVNTGIESPQLELEISTYNTMLLARNSIASNSSATNPLVEDYDQRLKSMRESVMKSINMNISQLNASLVNMRKLKQESNAKIAGTPAQAEYLISIERKQSVMEQLYLFLLQKREENQVQQAYSNMTIRVITPPFGPLKPVAPKKSLILFMFLLVGVAIPAVYYYMGISSNTMVMTTEDLESLSIPIVGEIPMCEKKQRFRLLRKGWNLLFPKQSVKDRIPFATVENDGCPRASESFDIAASNLKFLAGNKSDSDICMITAMRKESGKSFVAYNLALAMASKQKRVLLIDAELRRGSLSGVAGYPNSGLTDYLAGNTSDWRSLTVKDTSNAALSILSVGTPAPNPTELCDNGRLELLLNQAKEDYDFILIDAPAETAIETKVIGKFADNTLFVIKAGEMNKNEVAGLEHSFESKDFNRICVLLNGVPMTYSS